jgi:hypothetical protein
VQRDLGFYIDGGLGKYSELKSYWWRISLKKGGNLVNKYFYYAWIVMNMLQIW